MTGLLDEGKTPEDLIEIIAKVMDPEIVDFAEPKFSCNCSKERVKKALISIGGKELDSMIEEGKNVQLHCAFCNTDYDFTVEELKEIREIAK